MFRRVFISSMIAIALAATAAAAAGSIPVWPSTIPLFILVASAFDVLQRRHSLLRNYPIVGRLRFALERIRPEMRQYFGESDLDGRPFARETRSLVYQRAKGDLQTIPFGTKRRLEMVGTEWIPHAIQPLPPNEREPRVMVGEHVCTRPYSASRLNVAAMSYGALSATAIVALNRGAGLGGFAHNTGEGGVSAYHLEGGGDLVWQIGTGYFGCRDRDGAFDPARFAERASAPAIKMVEIKLSQGAKPGYGGILPASKVTPEIAALRGVPLGERVVSPPFHSAFSGPKGLLELVARLRELSGGKPVGVKLCIGRPRDFFALCKAMRATGIVPDYFAIDGAEAGTGAAPFEFVNHVGAPLDHGLWLAHGALLGTGLRTKTKLFASGRIATGFDIFRVLALGADGCFAGRAMMLALGCIQALRCNSNDCPVGVATQDPKLYRALDPVDKAQRVARYHAETVRGLLALVGAAGLAHPDEVTPDHIFRRGSANTVVPLAQIFEPIRDGSFLEGDIPEALGHEWRLASAETFAPIRALDRPRIVG